MHIPRNFFIALTGMKLTDQLTLASYYGTAILFQTLAYPFLTIQRRLECRSNARIAMLPNEIYKKGSFINCFRTMIAEEGPLSLYRGYTFHLFAMLTWLAVMPLATDYLMAKFPAYIDPN